MTKATKQFIAAKAIIVNDDGRALLLKQNDPDCSGDGKLHPPGGRVELGESLSDSLRREIKEEIGVEAEIGRLVDVGEWQATMYGETYQAFGLYYLCTIKNYNFTLQSEEVSEAVWVGLDEISSATILEPAKTIIEQFLRSQFN